MDHQNFYGLALAFDRHLHVGISITNRTRLVCFSLSVGSFSNLNSNFKFEFLLLIPLSVDFKSREMAFVCSRHSPFASSTWRCGTRSRVVLPRFFSRPTARCDTDFQTMLKLRCRSMRSIEKMRAVDVKKAVDRTESHGNRRRSVRSKISLSTRDLVHSPRSASSNLQLAADPKHSLSYSLRTLPWWAVVVVMVKVTPNALAIGGMVVSTIPKP